MTPVEFSRRIALEQINDRGLNMVIAATAEECLALAARFGLHALDRLEADISLKPQGPNILLTAMLKASVVYVCRITARPLPADITEAVKLTYKAANTKTSAGPQDNQANLEIELDADDLDTEWLDPQGIDVGEAIAQALSLALNPYPRAEDADAALPTLGILTEEQNRRTPFAVLKGLKD
jgi:uncharacterized metal-binding protein YceD (DUF177 family)